MNKLHNYNEIVHMEWFDRQEFEQDKNQYSIMICKKIPVNMIMLLLILLYCHWKSTSHIEWKLFISTDFWEYIIVCYLCLTIGIYAVMKGGLTLLCWVIDNKKKALKYLIWISISLVVSILFNAFFYYPFMRLAREYGF